MRIFLLLSALFISNVAFAQWQLFPVGLEARYENGATQDYEYRRFWNFSAAYKSDVLSSLLEYSRSANESGNATSSISRVHQEMVVWGRWHFYHYKEDNYIGSLYGGLGAGVYQDQVKTNLLSDSRTDNSKVKFLSGLTAGGDITIPLYANFDMVAALELRAFFAGDFDPNPTGSGVFRIGIQWNLN